MPGFPRPGTPGNASGNVTRRDIAGQKGGSAGNATSNPTRTKPGDKPVSLLGIKFPNKDAAVKWMQNHRTWVRNNYDKLYKDPKSYYLLATAGMVRRSDLEKKQDAHDRGSQGNKNMARPPRSGGGRSGGGGGRGGANGPIVIQAPGIPEGYLVDPVTGKKIPMSLIRKHAPALTDPSVFAENQAAIQYDTMISQLERQKNLTAKEKNEAMKSLDSWYTQILGSLQKAGERDREITQAGVSSVQDITKSIISSIGGEANLASPTVGAAGVSEAGTLQALGAVQDQYNQDMGPIVEMEGASQKARVQAAAARNMAELSAQIADALKERGQAKTSAFQQALDYNNQLRQQQLQNLLGARQANNALAQQIFQNKMGLNQTLVNNAIAQQEFGLKAAGMVQDAREDQASNRAAALKARQGRLKDAMSNLMPLDAAMQMPWASEASPDGTAPPQLVNHVLDSMKLAGINLGNPWAKAQAVRLIERYGMGTVNPTWVSQWN